MAGTGVKGQFRPKSICVPRYEEGVPGLPSRAMVVTNSEMSTAWCSLRWWFAYGERLTTSRSTAMYFGSLMHEVLEHMYRFWGANPGKELKFDSLLAGNGGPGILTQLQHRLSEESPEDAGELFGRLCTVSEGYLESYGRCGPEGYKVVAVELPVAMPVLNPATGRVYISRLPVKRVGSEWHLAAPGDKREDCRMVSIPWYKVGRLDAVVKDSSGNLWVWEFKTSASPATYGRNLALDTQIPGYALALSQACSLPEYASLLGGSNGVKGYVWDVLGSAAHKDPRILKNGKLSMADQKVPSWRWAKALQAEQSSRSKYTQEEWDALCERPVQAQAGVDPLLYHREWDVFYPNDLARYQAELYAKVRGIADMRRSIFSGEHPDSTGCG